MARNLAQLYPDFTAELEEVRNTIGENGIDSDTLRRIIEKHSANSDYNKQLYGRYLGIEGCVPIHNREPHFKDENDPINNKLANDFFGEIVDFKTGYFAGKPVMYGYSKTEEAENSEKATKIITDFVVNNNMHSCDMEITKIASIYGYAGRLFYIDVSGNVRVKPLQGFETIILTTEDISEPEYAVRYFCNLDISGNEVWTAEVYDDTYYYTYKGQKNSMAFVEKKPHLFDFCPLQGIANNSEMIGDAEKVLSLIDDYDKVLSDNSNETESFAHAYMVFENAYINDDDEFQRMKKTGAIFIPPTGTTSASVRFLTKDVNDTFTEHHLERLEDNIYRFSQTPNLADETFSSASGVSLKFKLHGLETKCGMFEAKMRSAATYMWKVVSSAWQKRNIYIDPLQVIMEFTRNFPLDMLSEAQTVQMLINAGLPKEIAYSQLSFVDDVDYVMQMIESEKEQDGFNEIDISEMSGDNGNS